ncbi:DVU_1556 family methyltransferase [Acetobacterium carbinolicum]|jgi:ubiquinone/menaquinone biosynthesis C-methylase UbiE|uniref:DVU_1556 family methyltransferase n=1 Tax=Acetobacterium TaxID=33951 RepID=UPI000DBEB5D8|nr:MULTISPECIES: methyltransferase domain-containing protein [unclassified Acetobacterium]AWW25236.1 SAM-dependent methyltransferase [Acetobacterium sp. KB-1]MDZ5725721.1 methyltransferase domain-containing protein [Acetobacterium sp. K1/6]
MVAKCAYETPEMKALLGETLRPGGTLLTDKGVAFCQWKETDRLLDLGCGRGATVDYLKRVYNIRAVGLDPSQKLLAIAKKNNPNGLFYQGRGEQIPFENDSFEGALSECTLSLMTNREAALKELHRVLKKGGHLFITDVYARNPDALKGLISGDFDSCMRGLYALNQLENQILETGFMIERMEDHSHFLKTLLVKTVFEYGSMNVFWKKAAGRCAAGFQDQLRACKPGYYLMVARKVK